MHNADYEDLLIHTRCRCQGQTKASIPSIPALAFANQNTKHVILFLKLQSPTTDRWKWNRKLQTLTLGALLTYHGEPSVGTDGGVEFGRSDLTLVLGIVLDRGVRYSQIVDAEIPVGQHRVPRVPRYGVGKSCRRKREKRCVRTRSTAERQRQQSGTIVLAC